MSEFVNIEDFFILCHFCFFQSIMSLKKQKNPTRAVIFTKHKFFLCIGRHIAARVNLHKHLRSTCYVPQKFVVLVHCLHFNKAIVTVSIHFLHSNDHMRLLQRPDTCFEKKTFHPSIAKHHHHHRSTTPMLQDQRSDRRARRDTFNISMIRKQLSIIIFLSKTE